MDLTKHHARRSKTPAATPQTAPMPGRTDMVPNSAGGYGWQVTPWAQLERFLVLGTEGGTYYLTEAKVTKLNAVSAEACIKEDGLRVVRTVVDVSDGGRALSNDPALFVLAMAAAAEDAATRKAALAALPRVARTGTHLLHFVAFGQAFRGWGRGLRTAVSRWYLDKPNAKLVHQVLKYPQRDGFSQRDAIRLGHPKAKGAVQNAILSYVVKGVLPELGEQAVVDALAHGEDTTPLATIEAVLALTKDTPVKQVVNTITDFGLTHEMIPTEHKNHPDVWAALLPHMPVTATIRNLGTMTKIGLLKPLSDAERLVVERITDQDVLVKARVHPISLLVALKTYASGQGFRSDATWAVLPKVTGALDAAFYLAFKAVEPTGKRILYGLDVSASMSASASGKPVTCAEVATALALVLANTESNWHIMAFDQGIRSLNVHPKWSLEEALKKTSNINGGGTDCALPMVWANTQGIDCDAFVVLTDNETWYGGSARSGYSYRAGHGHPKQALDAYRRARVADAKLAVLALTPSAFTIADPLDAGMLDLVGFDTNMPQILSTFIGSK